MKTLLICLTIGLVFAGKLDRTYLPPPGANLSEGSFGDVDVPFEFSKESHRTTSAPKYQVNFNQELNNNGKEIGMNPRTNIPDYDNSNTRDKDFTYFQRTYKVPTTTTSYAFTQTTTYSPVEGYETTINPIGFTSNTESRNDFIAHENLADPFSQHHNIKAFTVPTTYSNFDENPLVIGANNNPVNASTSTLEYRNQDHIIQFPQSTQIFGGNRQTFTTENFIPTVYGPTQGRLPQTEVRIKSKKPSDNIFSEYPEIQGQRDIKENFNNHLSDINQKIQITQPHSFDAQHNMQSVTEIPNVRDEQEMQENIRKQPFEKPIYIQSHRLKNNKHGSEPSSFRISQTERTQNLPANSTVQQDTLEMNVFPQLSGSSNNKPGEKTNHIDNNNISKTLYIHRHEQPQCEVDRNAYILNYENIINPEGFAYSFDTSNGIHADENGTAINGVRAEGSYSYIGDDGKEYKVTYTADENGFIPRGDHLPTPPPIPEQIQRIIDLAKLEKEAGIVHDGFYDEERYGYRNYEKTLFHKNVSNDQRKQNTELQTKIRIKTPQIPVVTSKNRVQPTAFDYEQNNLNKSDNYQIENLRKPIYNGENQVPSKQSSEKLPNSEVQYEKVPFNEAEVRQPSIVEIINNIRPVSVSNNIPISGTTRVSENTLAKDNSNDTIYNVPEKISTNQSNLRKSDEKPQREDTTLEQNITKTKPEPESINITNLNTNVDYEEVDDFLGGNKELQEPKSIMSNQNKDYKINYDNRPYINSPADRKSYSTVNFSHQKQGALNNGQDEEGNNNENGGFVKKLFGNPIQVADHNSGISKSDYEQVGYQYFPPINRFEPSSQRPQISLEKATTAIPFITPNIYYRNHDSNLSGPGFKPTNPNFDANNPNIIRNNVNTIPVRIPERKYSLGLRGKMRYQYSSTPRITQKFDSTPTRPIPVDVEELKSTTDGGSYYSTFPTSTSPPIYTTQSFPTQKPDTPSTTYRPNFFINNAGPKADTFGRPLSPEREEFNNESVALRPGFKYEYQPLKPTTEVPSKFFAKGIPGTSVIPAGIYTSGSSNDEEPTTITSRFGSVRPNPVTTPYPGYQDQNPGFPVYPNAGFIGEDFSGPKQQQRFDPVRGYYY